MGIWNAHASVGNIAGSIVAASALRYGWGWSFVFPALAIIIFGVFIFLFLVVEPACLGLPSPHEVDQHNATLDDEERDFLMSYVHITAGLNVVTEIEDTSSIRNVEVPISFGVDWDIHESLDEKPRELRTAEDHGEVPSYVADYGVAIGFAEAWRIPGVAQYAFCLFFVKLVAYTFLFWLPFYIKHTG